MNVGQRLILLNLPPFPIGKRCALSILFMEKSHLLLKALGTRGVSKTDRHLAVFIAPTHGEKQKSKDRKEREREHQAHQHMGLTL